jgi:Domain of unknown function (DUF4365)
MKKNTNQKMPKRVVQHVTGDKGIAYLSSFIIGIGWTIEEVARDYGVDVKIEAFHKNEALGFLFFAQSKATEAKRVKKRKISKSFRESESNYLIELNSPVLVTQLRLSEDKMFYRWVISAKSFIKTGKSYKFDFYANDFIDFKSPESFIKSVMSIRSIEKFKKGGYLGVKIVGSIKNILKTTKVFDLYCTEFDGRICVDAEAVIGFVVNDSVLELEISGVVKFHRSYTSENFMFHIADLISILSELSEKAEAIYSSELLKLHFQENINIDSLILVNSLFYKKFNHERLLDFLIQSFNSDEKTISNCQQILQLRYFDLSFYSKQRLLDLTRNQYKNSKDLRSFLNYLSILQAESSDGLKELMLDLEDEVNSLDLPDRLLVEVANASIAASRPDLALKL